MVARDPSTANGAAINNTTMAITSSRFTFFIEPDYSTEEAWRLLV